MRGCFGSVFVQMNLYTYMPYTHIVIAFHMNVFVNCIFSLSDCICICVLYELS